jgi:dihydropteroate synthase
MGILNVTPDSFSDGGRFLEPGSAVDRAGQMIAEGAGIIDVGGASSRPRGSAYGDGASVVSPVEESGRVVPVIAEIKDRFPDVMISIDTWSARVAHDAIGAGAHIINDITAMRADPEMAPMAGKSGLPVILMHSTGLPGDMPHQTTYKDVVMDVCAALQKAADRALAAGCSQVVLDPGIGFGKTTADNMTLIAQLDNIVALGWPVLVGASRKTSVGRVLGSETDPVPVDQRLAGSLAAAAHGTSMGASIIRTHDVRETCDLLTVLTAIRDKTGNVR